jgi:hypothetical protein
MIVFQYPYFRFPARNRRGSLVTLGKAGKIDDPACTVDSCSFSLSASAHVFVMAEALGLAASVITVVDLFVKVGVLCSVYCASLKTVRRDVGYILNEADKFTATLKEADRLLAGPDGAQIVASQNVRRGVADCRLQLDDLVT